MARLILLNGPPGAGKTTLARRWIDDNPRARLVDLDRLRAGIEGWRDRRHEAGLLARAQAIATARTQLMLGRDVIVPQLLGRLEFVERLAALSHECRAEFVELAILDDRDAGWRRLQARTAVGADPLDLDAGEEVPDRATFDGWYDRVSAVVSSRPTTRLVTATADPDASYAALVEALRR